MTESTYTLKGSLKAREAGATPKKEDTDKSEAPVAAPAGPDLIYVSPCHKELTIALPSGNVTSENYVFHLTDKQMDEMDKAVKNTPIIACSVCRGAAPPARNVGTKLPEQLLGSMTATEGDIEQALAFGIPPEFVQQPAAPTTPVPTIPGLTKVDPKEVTHSVK